MGSSMATKEPPPSQHSFNKECHQIKATANSTEEPVRLTSYYSSNEDCHRMKSREETKLPVKTLESDADKSSKSLTETRQEGTRTEVENACSNGE